MAKDVEAQKLSAVEKDLKEFQNTVDKEEKELKRLFGELKTSLIQECLRPDTKITEKHLGILDEQVRHVISIARAIGFSDLAEMFEEEEKVIKQIRSLVEVQYGVTSASSPALREAFERIRSMLTEEQNLIFSHEKILMQEKRRLIWILQQVKGLQADHEKNKSLERPVSQDAQQQYI